MMQMYDGKVGKKQCYIIYDVTEDCVELRYKIHPQRPLIQIIFSWTHQKESTKLCHNWDESQSVSWGLHEWSLHCVHHMNEHGKCFYVGLWYIITDVCFVLFQCTLLGVSTVFYYSRWHQKLGQKVSCFYCLPLCYHIITTINDIKLAVLLWPSTTF